MNNSFKKVTKSNTCASKYYFCCFNQQNEIKYFCLSTFNAGPYINPTKNM